MLQETSKINRFTAINGAQVLCEKWNRLANTLNSIGGAKKTGEKRKKFWDDLK